MRIILIGIPGSGKSTQGNLLSKQLKLPYVSAGHIFRLLAKEKTAQGRYIKEVLHSGDLLPESKSVPIIEEYMSRPMYRRGFILDGFPRTVDQAKRFSQSIDAVLYITLDDKDALWRIAYRTEERDDSGAATIIHRIETFHKTTDDVIEHFRQAGLLQEVDGTGTIEEVNEALLKALGKDKVHNTIKAWEQRDNILIAFAGLPGSGVTTAVNHLEDEKDHVTVNVGSLNKDDCLEKIKRAFESSKIVVVNGLTSLETYQYLQNKLTHTQTYLVAVWSSKNIRKERTGKALNDDASQIGSALGYADYLIKNNDSVEDLQHQAEHIFREIYFDLD